MCTNDDRVAVPIHSCRSENSWFPVLRDRLFFDRVLREKISLILVNHEPTKLDVELAASQIPNDAKGDLDVVLDQIGKNVIADSETLIANWREITEKNIAIWFK